MKSLKSLIITGLFGLTALASPAVLAEDKLPSGTAYQDIGPKIEAFVKEHEDTTAGMETAVVTADETLYEGHFGYINKEKNIKADENAVFEWGSVSKTLIWVSVMQQVEAGRIDLNEDIRTYLPEGFLKNLKFDKPITMLDLMNHKAGFQEAVVNVQVAKAEDLMSLKDYLANFQPMQNYEPGMHTGYSNWGAALASLIVQEVTGQDYAAYVKEKIFEPLGMNRTSIKPDRSDNAYVTKERVKNQSYDATGKAIGRRDSWINPYSEGAAISTLSDFRTYAQALLKQEEGVLFEKKATWEEFFSASAVYSASDVPSIYHGFLTTEYGLSVLSHHGLTLGYSSVLMLDLENQVGMVVMTNQSLEKLYNTRLPELIFGRYEDSALSKLPKDSYSGNYLQSTTILEGPLSFISPAYIFRGQSEDFAKEIGGSGDYRFYTVSKSPDGREKISISAADFLEVSQGQVWLLYGTTLAGALALVYAVGHLLVSAVIWLIRKLKKKPAPAQSKIGLHLLTGLMVLAGLLLGTLFLAITTENIPIISATALFAMGFAVIGSAMIALIIWCLLRRPKGQMDWKAKLHYGLTLLASLGMLWYIYFFDLYQWWMIS